jgi:hypothetical protein
MSRYHPVSAVQRPPVLLDLLNDIVSAAVQVPAMQKAIVISGMEFPLAG